MTPLLSILALGTAVFAIWGEYKPTRTQVYIFKPLTTILIIILALQSSGLPTTPAYKWLIVVGLFFCLGGDVFLMFPARYFLFGLVSFLIGHIFYIVAFTMDAGLILSWWLLPLILFGIGIYALLHNHLDKMRIPVIAYIVIILFMAVQALGRWSAQPGPLTGYAALGAVSFVFSDAVLALDRFRQKFTAARVIVLSSYWLAQWLIALSVGA